MPDGHLWLIRDTYTAETQRAPQHVGRELRLVRLGVSNAEQEQIHAEAEAEAARKQAAHQRAARHDFWAASYQAMANRYRQQEETFTHVMQDRHNWEQATAASRHLANAADAELRRRHPNQRIEPLRSAEPAPANLARCEEVTLGSGRQIGKIAQWIHELATQRKAFREKHEQCQGLMIPSENPVRENLGQAFPRQTAFQREAILQPPKPEIRPSAKILKVPGSATPHQKQPAESRTVTEKLFHVIAGLEVGRTHCVEYYRRQLAPRANCGRPRRTSPAGNRPDRSG